MEGIDILRRVDERSKRLDGIQKQKEEEEKQRQEKAAEAERLGKEQEAKKKEGEKNKLGLDIGEKSIPSEAHLDRNEDAILSLKEKRVFGVFDGVGGNAAGDVASRLAVETVLNNLKELQDGLSEEEVEHHLKIALIGANTKVFNEAKKNNNDMASTGVIGYVLKDQDGKMKVIIGSVGDSRAYIQTKDGILKQITIDDNNVREKFKDEKEARRVQETLSNVQNANDLAKIPEDERELFEGRRKITQAIGHEENVAPNIYAQDFQEGDRLVFLTDGISDNLTDNEINKIISESKNSQEATGKLTEAASKRSKETGIRSKKDDMSAIVVGISDLSKKEPEPKGEPSGSITPETPKEPVAQKTEVPKSTEPKSVELKPAEQNKEILPVEPVVESSLGQQETSTQEPEWRDGDMVEGGRKIKKIEGGIATLVKFGQEEGVEEKVPVNELRHFDSSK